MNRHLKSALRHLLPRSVSPHHILRGPLQGSQIVTSWQNYPAAILGYTESCLLRWLHQNVRPGDTWLDVGAHYGYTAIAFSQLVGEMGRVFAFEPVLRTAGSLVQTGLLNHFRQLTVLPVALGTPPELELHRFATVRGMAESTVSCGESFETMLVARLDWLWPRICGERKQVEGVKIDVQGMEIEALLGMSELLNEYKPKLVVEIHPGVSRERLLDVVERLGYNQHGMPIEAAHEEIEPRYIDNHSYAFLAG